MQPLSQTRGINSSFLKRHPVRPLDLVHNVPSILARIVRPTILRFPLRLSLNFKTFADEFSLSAPHGIGYPFLSGPLYPIWTSIIAPVAGYGFLFTCLPLS